MTQKSLPSLPELIRIWTCPHEMFPMADHAAAIRFADREIKKRSLAIPSDSRLWDDSAWDYMMKGLWFLPTSDMLRKAHRCAKKHGFACDHDAPFTGAWRDTFPKWSFPTERKAPVLP